MKTELLAPAGSMEALKAAVSAGADAVYLGGAAFGARAYAKNLAEQEILYAIDYVHLRNRKLYLTVNTLLKEEELEEKLYPYLRPYYEQGLDAVIVQDMGVLKAVSYTHLYREIESGEKPVYTFGPIIHNEQVVEDLENRGVQVIHSEDELEGLSGGTVVIRSHGVSRDVCEKIKARGMKIVDATCPFVKKIHRIVDEEGRKGRHVVIIGSAAVSYTHLQAVSC